MAEERKVRLHQVARELKVGQGTIIDFLDKKGIKVENSPSSFIEPEAFALLEKEFGSSGKGGERINIRERINLRQETISLDSKKESPKPEEDFKEETVIKSGVISIRDEVAAIKSQAPKILGKIDLDSKPAPAAPKPAPAPVAEKPAATVAAPKPEPAPAVEKPAAAAPKPEPTVAAPKPATPKPAPAPAPVVEKPVAAPEKPVEKAPEAPQAEPVVVQTQTYDDRMAANNDNVFRADDEGTKLSGPKVLGKVDVSTLEKPRGGGDRREKRKRITKDKVDVSRPGSPGQAAGQGGARPAPGAGKGKPAGGPKGAKPVFRPEVSDEDVQKKIKDTLARLTSKGGKSKSSKYRRDKRDAVSARMTEEIDRQQVDKSTLQVTEFVTVSELASMMDVPVTEVIKACMNLGLMVSINQRLDAEALVVVAEEFGFKVEFVSVEIQESIEDETDEEEDLVARPPIVTVMGHVDHGKTSLLDNIRSANVIAGEAGGITQHIGAYSVKLDGRRITFLDTPGHEAFTAMRARGAKVTDVAIIIVAADDSVMPQTIEAINHATAAGVPMVFAINKIDKEGTNPEKIKEQLAGMNLLVEDWGGKYQSQEVSAKKGLNVDKLLEKVLLEAEFLDLRANPAKKASGTVIESTLDKGRGYVSTVLVHNGTLRVGDVLLAGTYSGRVKAMFNERGNTVDEAGHAYPVLVIVLYCAAQSVFMINFFFYVRCVR